MSDELESLGMPDELRDLAGRLRGLRPVSPTADEAACMYQAGWQAALAAQVAPATRGAPSWLTGSYLGGVISGALVSGSLTAALVLGMTTSRTEPEAVPDASRVAQESVAPAAETLAAQNSAGEPNPAERSRPLEAEATTVRAMSDELMTTALLSPMARQQWRASLTRGAAPYASARTEATTPSAPMTETLRSSPRGIDRSLF